MEHTKRVCQAGNGQRAYMIYGDLDHLKEINDTWGHPAGNFALRSVAEILKGCLRSNDILGRVGGDEYIIMLECEEGDFGEKFRERVKMACKLFNEKSGKPFFGGDFPWNYRVQAECVHRYPAGDLPCRPAAL